MASMVIVFQLLHVVRLGDEDSCGARCYYNVQEHDGDGAADDGSGGESDVEDDCGDADEDRRLMMMLDFPLDDDRLIYISVR